MNKPVKVGDFVFQVDNGGLVITVESNVRRFDPAESVALLNYLDEHREEIQRAYTPEAAEPAPFSQEWHDQKLNEAFGNMPE